jgi:dihydroorotate dehydrogenase electron transfer subunit
MAMMTKSLAEAISINSPILSRRLVGDSAWVIELELLGLSSEVLPGQFAMLSLSESSPTLIPRPFSVYQYLGNHRYSFLIQKFGAGTACLVEAPIGTRLRCTLPLGNGFQVAERERDVVMVAGGVGSAPFLLYAEQRCSLGAGNNTFMFYGGRTSNHLFDSKTFDAIGVPIYYATDDGSAGYTGNVIDCLKKSLDDNAISAEALFLACGPEGMLHAFAKWATKENLNAFLSLETYMGCGYGVCNACPVSTSSQGKYRNWPYVKTCTDGPVFDISDIIF